MKSTKHLLLFLLVPVFYACGPDANSAYIKDELKKISDKENCTINFENETTSGGERLILLFECDVNNPYMPGRVLDELLVKLNQKKISHYEYVLQSKNKKLFFILDQPGVTRAHKVKEQFIGYLHDYTNNEINGVYTLLDTSIKQGLGTKQQLDSIVAATPHNDLKFDGYAVFSDSLKNSYIQLQASNKQKNLFSLTFSADPTDKTIYGFFIK